MDNQIRGICCRCFHKKEIIGYAKTVYRIPRYCEDCVRALEDPEEQKTHQPFLDMMMETAQ